MRFGKPKKNSTPVPPEYANVRTLKWIAFLVAAVCLAITGYTTWTIYVLSNRIGMHEISLEVANISRRTAPINFNMLDSVRTIDKEKKSFMLPAIDWDMFYQRTITSTSSSLPSVTITPPTSTTSTQPLL